VSFFMVWGVKPPKDTRKRRPDATKIAAVFPGCAICCGGFRGCGNMAVRVTTRRVVS